MGIRQGFSRRSLTRKASERALDNNNMAVDAMMLPTRSHGSFLSEQGEDAEMESLNGGLSETAALRRALALSLSPQGSASDTAAEELGGEAAGDPNEVPVPDPAAPLTDWAACYAAWNGKAPGSRDELFHFAKNRGCRATYRAFREAFPHSAMMHQEAHVPPPPPNLALLVHIHAVDHQPPPAPVAPPRERRRPRDSALLRCGWHHEVTAGFSEGECCAICLDDDATGIVELHCAARHRFHGSCVEEWVARTCSQRCPTCRQAFLPEGVFVSVPTRPTTDASFRS